MGLFSSKKTSSTTYAESNNFNLQDVAGQPIVGNSGAVTINTIDAGAIAANQSVSQSAIAGMSDTAASSLFGMATISAVAMEAAQRSADTAAATARDAMAGNAALSAAALSSNANISMGANVQMGNLAGDYLDKAAALTMGVVSANSESLAFAERAGNNALNFAYEAGRPEAAIMDKSITAVMVIGGALALVMFFRK